IEDRIQLSTKQTKTESVVRIGLIGAGDYAKAMLLPNFKQCGAEFQSIMTASGVSARSVGDQYGFRFCVSGADEVLNDPKVNLVVIATRPASHGELTRRALEAGKHVFVEKPLATTDEELDGILAAATSGGALMVGFNRRFSPLARAAQEFFASRQTPLSISYRVNAGHFSPNHSIQDPREGGR